MYTEHHQRMKQKKSFYFPFQTYFDGEEIYDEEEE